MPLFVETNPNNLDSAQPTHTPYRQPGHRPDITTIRTATQHHPDSPDTLRSCPDRSLTAQTARTASRLPTRRPHSPDRTVRVRQLSSRRRVVLEGQRRTAWAGDTLMPRTAGIATLLLGVSSGSFQFLRGEPHCPRNDSCAYLGGPARYTGRYAVVMAGRLRTAHDMLRKMLSTVGKRYSDSIRVDWFFHVWFDGNSTGCEGRTLQELKRIATAITVEPVECMRSWGVPDRKGQTKSFHHQWHGVDMAWKTLMRFGRRPEEYTLILKSRVDAVYGDLDFQKFWRVYSASVVARRSNGHFAVLGKSQGWDVHLLATPPLARVYAAYGARSGFDCDSAYDAFPIERMFRYGCWPPVRDAAQTETMAEAAHRMAHKDSRGKEPRCAPLFIDPELKASLRRAVKTGNPVGLPALGCANRRLGDVLPGDSRRLGGHHAIFPPDEFCYAHRHDVFYVSPEARHTNRTDRTHGAPQRRCPPDCSVIPPIVGDNSDNQTTRPVS